MKSTTNVLVLSMLILSLNALAQNQQQALTPYGNNPKAGHYALAEGAKMYYEVYGKGKPFVLLHGGIMGSIGEMAQFIDSLSGTYLANKHKFVQKLYHLYRYLVSGKRSFLGQRTNRSNPKSHRLRPPRAAVAVWARYVTGRRCGPVNT